MFEKILVKFLDFSTKSPLNLLLGCLGTILFIILFVFAFGIPFLLLLDFNKWLGYTLFAIIFLMLYAKVYKEDRRLKIADKECFSVGKLLFENYELEFNKYYSLYLKDKIAFCKKYKRVLNKVSVGLEDLKHVDVLYAFASDKKLTQIINASCEENEFGIEEAIEKLLETKVSLLNTQSLRALPRREGEEEYEFVIEILKSIDKDLQNINMRLLFLDSVRDNHIVLCIKKDVFEFINGKNILEIHGVDRRLG